MIKMYRKDTKIFGIFLILIGFTLVLMTTNIFPMSLTCYSHSLLVSKNLESPTSSVPYNWVKSWSEYGTLTSPNEFDTSQLYIPIWAGNGSRSDIIKGVNERFSSTMTLVYEDSNYFIFTYKECYIKNPSPSPSQMESSSSSTTKENTGYLNVRRSELMFGLVFLGLGGFVLVYGDKKK